MVRAIPFGKLQKIWAVFWDGAFLVFFVCSVYSAQSAPDFVACRSSTTSNFLVLCLCARFPPECFVLIVNTPIVLITDHVLMNKNVYKLVEHDCPGERSPE